MTRAHDTHAREVDLDGADDPEGPDGPDGTGERERGRHRSAVATLERAVEPVVEDMGYELVLLEWLGSGKRRVLRLYLDRPTGVSIEDCSKMSRIVGNALDASEAAATAGVGAGPGVEIEIDPALAALLGRPYTLEVSSPGVDRPLTKRRHFEDHVGGRVKIETWTPLGPDEGGLESEKKFHGRIAAVEEDPAAPEDQRTGVVVVHDAERDRTLRIPLPRVRRANLVWEF